MARRIGQEVYYPIGLIRLKPIINSQEFQQGWNFIGLLGLLTPKKLPREELGGETNPGL